ncbi:MAG: hypothetical protein ACRDRX_07255 [Pseudonocardiaceae bacterium]
MKPYVGTPCLATYRQRELVGVGPQIADVVQHCGAGVRDHRLLGSIKPLPRRRGWVELQPSRAQR